VVFDARVPVFDARVSAIEARAPVFDTRPPALPPHMLNFADDVTPQLEWDTRRLLDELRARASARSGRASDGDPRLSRSHSAGSTVDEGSYASRDGYAAYGAHGSGSGSVVSLARQQPLQQREYQPVQQHPQHELHQQHQYQHQYQHQHQHPHQHQHQHSQHVEQQLHQQEDRQPAAPPVDSAARVNPDRGDASGGDSSGGSLTQLLLKGVPLSVREADVLALLQRYGSITSVHFPPVDPRAASTDCVITFAEAAACAAATAALAHAAVAPAS
jgi:hypothetical protein